LLFLFVPNCWLAVAPFHHIYCVYHQPTTRNDLFDLRRIPLSESFLGSARRRDTTNDITMKFLFTSLRLLLAAADATVQERYASFEPPPQRSLTTVSVPQSTSHNRHLAGSAPRVARLPGTLGARGLLRWVTLRPPPPPPEKKTSTKKTSAVLCWSKKTYKCKIMPVDAARLQRHTWFTHHPTQQWSARSSIFGKHYSTNHLLPTVSTANCFGGCAATRITKVRSRPIKPVGYISPWRHRSPRRSPSRMTTTKPLARARRRRNGIGNAWHDVVERWPGHYDVVGGRQGHVVGGRQGHDDVFGGRQGHDDNVERRARVFIWWCRTAAKTWRRTARPWR
jgi:hypothetical protein